MSGDTNAVGAPSTNAAKAPAAAPKRTPKVGDPVVFVGYTVSEDALHGVIARVRLRAPAAPMANLAVLSPTGGWLPQFEVAYSEAKEQGTWHFPE